MIVDVHSHCHGMRHMGAYGAERRRVYGDVWVDPDPELYDATMSGTVDVAIVFGIRAAAVGIDTPHEHVAEFCAATRTPTIGFMALDLSDDDVIDRLHHGRELGLQGIKLYPTLANVDPRDPHHDRFYTEVAELGLPLLWHMGTSPASQANLEVSQPGVIDHVARRHPDVVHIMAHMAHPWQREAMIVLRKQPNVYADVSGQWSRTLEGYMAMRRAIEWRVTDRLLFGSDYPIWTPTEGIDGLKTLAAHDWSPFPNLDPGAMEDIIHRDTLSLLGLDDPRASGAATSD